MDLGGNSFLDYTLRIIFPLIIAFGIYRLLKYKLYVAEISFIMMWVGLEMVAKPEYEWIGRIILVLTLIAGPLLMLRLLDEIREKSIRDHLTGLYTRNYFFEEWLPVEINRQSRRENGKIAFLFLDIDNMKKINDKYGHATGDKILSHVAKVIMDSIRKSDAAVRMGGDEILVALPDVDEKTALSISKRISDNLSTCEGLDISLSFGIAIWRKGEDVEKIINLADKKMYEMKRSKSYQSHSHPLCS